MSWVSGLQAAGLHGLGCVRFADLEAIACTATLINPKATQARNETRLRAKTLNLINPKCEFEALAGSAREHVILILRTSSRALIFDMRTLRAQGNLSHTLQNPFFGCSVNFCAVEDINPALPTMRKMP